MNSKNGNDNFAFRYFPLVSMCVHKSGTKETYLCNYLLYWALKEVTFDYFEYSTVLSLIRHRVSNAVSNQDQHYRNDENIRRWKLS